MSREVPRYLSGQEVAARLGIQSGTLYSYVARGQFIQPDAYIGSTGGWLPETVEAWEATRNPNKRRPKTS